MGPIEVGHRNIVHLLKIIADALNAISGAKSPLDPQYGAICRRAAGDLAEIRNAYLLGVSPYIAIYMMQANGEGTAKEARGEAAAQASGGCAAADMLAVDALAADEALRTAYWDFISSRDIIGGINGCMRQIGAVAAGLCAEDAGQVSAIVARQDAFKVPLELNVIKSAFCDCGGRFIVFMDSNERRCATCGAVGMIYETVCDEVAMETAKAKQGRHHPHLHCKIWIGRIQAWDGPEIPDDVVRQLLACCRRDNVNRKRMTCAQTRKYLKELNLTAYNTCVPFIRKLLTGITPPQLTADELDKVYAIFAKIVAVLKKLRPDNNITYYPCIIYKILDSILSPGNRKAQILECIHLQSNKTMRLIDNIYEPICAEIDELKAKPTNKHEYKLLL